MFRKQELDEFLWGWGKDEKRLSENLTTYWSERCRSMAIDKYPDLSEKIFVSGAIGYDKYQFKKPNKISDISYKNILALLGSIITT